MTNIRLSILHSQFLKTSQKNYQNLCKKNLLEFSIKYKKLYGNYIINKILSFAKQYCAFYFKTTKGFFFLHSLM